MISGTRQHDAAGVYFRSEPRWASLNVDCDTAGRVDQHIERVSKPSPACTSRPCRRRVGSRYGGRLTARNASLLRGLIRLIRQPFPYWSGQALVEIALSHLALPTCVGCDERCIDRSIFMGNQPCL